MKIKILQNNTTKEMHLDLPSAMTVGDLKNLLAKKVKFDRTSMRVIAHGKLLKNDSESIYNIEDGTICLWQAPNTKRTIKVEVQAGVPPHAMSLGAFTVGTDDTIDRIVKLIDERTNPGSLEVGQPIKWRVFCRTLALDDLEKTLFDYGIESDTILTVLPQGSPEPMEVDFMASSHERTQSPPSTTKKSGAVTSTKTPSSKSTEFGGLRRGFLTSSKPNTTTKQTNLNTTNTTNNQPSAPTQTSVQSTTTTTPNNASSSSDRCGVCSKRLPLTAIKCKCDKYFCAQHRYAECHNCTFDYFAENQKKLSENNKKVVASKISAL